MPRPKGSKNRKPATRKASTKTQQQQLNEQTAELAARFDVPDSLRDPIEIPTLDEVMGIQTFDEPPPPFAEPPPYQPPDLFGDGATETPLSQEAKDYFNNLDDLPGTGPKFGGSKKKKQPRQQEQAPPPIQSDDVERLREIRKCRRYFGRFGERVSSLFPFPSNLATLPLETVRALNESIRDSLCEGDEEALIRFGLVEGSKLIENVAFPAIRASNSNPKVLSVLRRMANISRRLELAVDEELNDPIALVAIDYTGVSDSSPITKLIHGLSMVCIDHYNRVAATEGQLPAQPVISVDMASLQAKYQ